MMSNKPKTKVLMVCLGNICRSPLAEGILQSKLSKDFYIDSAGTAGYHVGELPDERSIKVARFYSIDISNQRSRKFVLQDFDIFDYIYVMDASNYQDIINFARNEDDKSKVHFILEENQNVPDPYYGGENGFENVYKMLDIACNRISEEL